MKKIRFKNGKHELNYLIQMKLVPKKLRASAEIQAVIYVIALIESESPSAAEYIFEYVKYLLGPRVFDHSNTDFEVINLSLHLWKATYLAFKEDFLYYFLQASALSLSVILDCDMLDFYVYLLDYFKDMNVEER